MKCMLKLLIYGQGNIFIIGDEGSSHWFGGFALNTNRFSYI